MRTNIAELTQEYTKRDLVSKYLLTRFRPITDILEANKERKLFKVDGTQSKLLSDLLSDIDFRPSKQLSRDKLMITISNISLRTSYSSLELIIRYHYKLDNGDKYQSTSYDEITMQLASFKSNGMNYDYNDIKWRDFNEVEQNIINYKGNKSLQDIIEDFKRMEILEDKINLIKKGQPYYSY